MDNITDRGKLWLEGNDITEFNGIKLSPKQIEFVNAKERMVLSEGGFASGKTTSFLIKLWMLCDFFPGNRILLGRKSRVDVEQATLPDLFEIFPEGTYTYRPGPGIIEFWNGSQILIYGLDVLQAGDADLGKSVQKIKSLNLGAVFIDQLEEIDFKVVEHLTGRLRKNIPLQQMNFTCNPANFWAYDYFKANPRQNTKLIQTSMMDNKDNLKPEFIADQMSKPKLYVDRYVHGIWDLTTLVEGTVFPDYHIAEMSQSVHSSMRSSDGIDIYHMPQDHEYQIGVDPSLGAEDPCYVAVVDKETGELAASFSGFVPNNVIVQKTFQLATMYSQKGDPLVVPEVTGAGQAFIEEFKKIYSNIYIREVFNHRENKKTRKLGFFTNFATKTQLIEHYRALMDKHFPKIRDERAVQEFRTFIYSDEAAKKGAGAQSNAHDDRVMGILLAYWGLSPMAPREYRRFVERDGDFGLYAQRYN